MATETVEFEVKGKDAFGKGELTDEGFLVKAGSLARREIVPSAQSTVPAVHQRLIDAGVLKQVGQNLRFAKDHLFETPSGAAAAILGRTANGWREWKRQDGVTLSEAMRVSRDTSKPLLEEPIRAAIRERFQELVDDNKLPTKVELDRQYSLFRSKFGPQSLLALEGERLLEFMHNSSSKDSLVYWLEFKKDHEFSARQFGSISGGSALKFRVFKRKETGNWQAGSEKGNKPEDISLEKAIAYAIQHRAQLLKGCELLGAFPANATDEDYAQLQDQMDELAPDVSQLAWGHKYFTLLFPNILDDYHNPALQRYHLRKLLLQPPEGEGRFVCAGRFVTAANEVGLCLNHLTSILNSLHGSQHRYWRIGTTAGNGGESLWPMMRDNRCVAIGWKKAGDLSWVDGQSKSKERLKKKLEAVYPNYTPTALGNECSQICQFVSEMAEGDIVLAASGMTILGIGRLKGEYQFHPKFEFPHQRKVEWLSIGEWKMPLPKEGLQSTVREIRKYGENLLAIERKISMPAVNVGPDKEGPQQTPQTSLSPTSSRIQSVLDRKGQVILYGPPGTGKTYWAERTAFELSALSQFGRTFGLLQPEQQKLIVGDGEVAGTVRLCCFHPAYGYEDFLEGYRPATINGQVTFQLRDGIFKQLCKDAASQPSLNFYLIIDEINRGDIPRIFGELLTVLEKDKRGKRIILPVSQEHLTIPDNVFLIGTMNTADRSISLLDAALRRRFGFVELMPDGMLLKDHAVLGVPLRAWFDALNQRIREHVGRDARNLQIGHSYFLHKGSPLKDFAVFKRTVRDEVVPLLEEYCYENFQTLELILGDQLVDTARQRICHELFDEGMEDELKTALLAPCPEIMSSSDAVTTDEIEREHQSENNDAIDDEGDL